MTRVIVFFNLFIVFIFSVNAQTISEWRGIGRTGVYNETGLLKKWPQNGPELLWSVKGLPKGYSSVAIGTDKLYLTGTKDSLEVLTAFDLKGNKLWETSFGRAWTASFPESRCTPTINNNRIYLITGKLDAACMDANSGKLIWSVKVNELFDGVCGPWGNAESPLVVGNKVLITPGGFKTSMIALDKLTGKTLWASESLKDSATYASPLIIERNGKQLIVGQTQKHLFGISPENGKIIWNFDYGALAGLPDHDNIQANTPLYWNGQLFSSNGYNHSNVLLELSPDGGSVSQKWSENVMDTHTGGDVRVGDYIFGSNWQNNAKGKWVCLEWKTGKVMYETEWITKGSIIAADGMLYCYEEKSGNIALVKPSPERFEIISSFKAPFGSGPHWAHPVINKGILYVRHGDALMAYNIKE